MPSRSRSSQSIALQKATAAAGYRLSLAAFPRATDSDTVVTDTPACSATSRSVTLDPPDDNDSDDCDSVSDDLIDEIRRSPRGFYVNVHTADYPNGAIRGQLFDVR